MHLSDLKFEAPYHCASGFSGFRVVGGGMVGAGLSQPVLASEGVWPGSQQPIMACGTSCGGGFWMGGRGGGLSSGLGAEGGKMFLIFRTSESLKYVLLYFL